MKLPKEIWTRSRVGRVRKPCKTCGKMMMLRPSQLLTRGFCSRSCQGSSRGPLTKQRQCLLCGEAYIIRGGGDKWCISCTPNTRWAARAALYGIGKPQWDRLLKMQKGTCALCPNEPTCVDHDHETKDVRGLLCKSCNTLMAGVDKPDWLDKAVAYREKNRG